MTVLGLCTHFNKTDEWAFNYALRLVRARDWQLTICHWLRSPYLLRRDIVQDDLFKPNKTLPVSTQLINKLELQLREYYDSKLGDFTNVAFKLCEGQYQIELTRCLRKNLLDLVVMGYQHGNDDLEPGVQSLEEFAQRLAHPLILVGRDGPESFLLNPKAAELLDHLDLPVGGWKALEPHHLVMAAE